MLEDPEHRRKQIKGTQDNWKNKDFRARHAEATRKELEERWKDSAFRKRNSEGLEKKRKDPEFRKIRSESAKNTMSKNWGRSEFRIAAISGSRRSRLNPEYNGRYYLFSVHGIRRDVGYAKSTWEANLLRIFKYVGRQFLTGERVRVSIPDRYQELFHENKISDVGLDCVVNDPRGNKRVYEIVTSKKNRIKMAKLEMIAEQHPDMVVRQVTLDIYRRLERRFREKINQDPRFAGWEDGKDNLRNNQAKYAPEDHKQPKPL